MLMGMGCLNNNGRESNPASSKMRIHRPMCREESAKILVNFGMKPIFKFAVMLAAYEKKCLLGVEEEEELWSN